MNNIYWAAETNLEKLSSSMVQKVRNFDDMLNSFELWQRWRMAACLYHGGDPKNNSKAADVQWSPNSGMLKHRINLFRRNLDSAHILITGVRPSFSPRANANDSSVTEAVVIADQLLDNALTKKGGEEAAKETVRHALMYSWSYMMTVWDTFSGNLEPMMDEMTGEPRYANQGDISFLSLRPDQVIFDVGVDENVQHDWYIVARNRSKQELIALYPDYEDLIQEATVDTVRQDESSTILNNKSKQVTHTDYVKVYELYHEKTSFLPNGRQAIMLNSVVIGDGPLRYRRIPIAMMSSGAMLPETGMATTHFFDAMGPQRVLDSSISSSTSIMDVLGVPIIWTGGGGALLAGADSADIASIVSSDGIKFLNTPQEPKPVEFAGGSVPALVSYAQYLQQIITDVSRLNDVALGNTSATSGKHLSMAHAMAQQASSDYQSSYASLFEKIGLMIIEVYRDFSTPEQTIMIVGRENQSMSREFHTEQLDVIEGIDIDIGTAVMKTAAGRKEVADMLLQSQTINQDQYLEIISTGKLEPVTDGPAKIRILLDYENQELAQGKPVPVGLYDNHPQHIAEHSLVLLDPRARANQQIIAAVQDQIRGHMEAWTQLYMQAPDAAAALNIPPPPSYQMMMAQQQQMAAMAAEEASEPNEPKKHMQNQSQGGEQGLPNAAGAGIVPSLGAGM